MLFISSIGITNDEGGEAQHDEECGKDCYEMYKTTSLFVPFILKQLEAAPGNVGPCLLLLDPALVERIVTGIAGVVPQSDHLGVVSDSLQGEAGGVAGDEEVDGRHHYRHRHGQGEREETTECPATSTSSTSLPLVVILLVTSLNCPGNFTTKSGILSETF